MTTTNLCVLKIIIYRVLQLPQFFFLFLFFLFLLLCESGLSLIIIFVILVFLWCKGRKKNNTELKIT